MIIVLIIALALSGISAALWCLAGGWRTPWKLPLRGGAVLLAFASALLTLIGLFGFVMCGRYDFAPVSSPDGRAVARVREEDCGAMDSFHSSVQLQLKKEGPFRDLFRGRSAEVFTIASSPRSLDLEWSGPDTLVIHYPNYSREPDEFSCRSRLGRIRIECVPYASGYGNRTETMPPVKSLFW